MSIGYACLAISPTLPKYKSCTLKNATKQNLMEIISHNLGVLEQMLYYNIEQEIKLFRITSDLIPFGSAKINDLEWEKLFAKDFEKLAAILQKNDIRVTMHPGQYTVLNSPNEDVVKRAVLDLRYHERVLTALQTHTESKMVLHVGGIYNEKEVAIERFIDHFKALPSSLKKRIIIENDDKSYTVEDVLRISKEVGVPVVFDTLHHEVNPPQEQRGIYEWIALCNQTWKAEDGVQKIHYSQQALDKKPGSHTKTILLDSFLDFYNQLEDKAIDIMLEVKDKNLSAVKCIHATRKNKHIKYLEAEWGRYKYTILENAPNHYLAIRKLLKDKQEYPVQVFYSLIEEALEMEPTKGNVVNAASHVWGYFKKVSSEKEKEVFQKKIEAFEQGKESSQSIKKYLWKMAVKYQEKYLLASYYFVL